MSEPSNAESNNTTLKRGSNDIGWEFGMLVNPSNPDKVKCKLCDKIVSGGIYRLKQHIGGIQGNVLACKKASDAERGKCIRAIEEGKNKKKQKIELHNDKVKNDDQLNRLVEEQEIEGLGSRKEPQILGPMDKFASPINLDANLTLRQQNINEALDKERRQIVHEYLARWVYEAGIPFNSIQHESFRMFTEAIGRFGRGYRPPSQYQLAEPLLKKEVERTKNSLKKQEEEWAKNDCSIMMDAWTDRKRRSIMNLCVNCKEGTTFLSSKEDSEEAHTGPYIFDYVDKCIEEVGPQNVIQVVTDNASNNMAAARLLKAKRPNMFWTSCATHTLNLMLQEIGNQPKFKAVIEKAKACTIFIYAHHKTLALMRKYTKKRDIVRSGVTRFATSFLTLQSLMEKKSELRLMVASSDWENCKHSKLTKGKMTYSTILNASFWDGVSNCLKVFAPLVKVLRLVDGDKRPSMGFLYGELQRAKREIKEAYKNNEVSYRPILQIIDEKARDRLDSPLHLAAYFLNPYYFFKDHNIQSDAMNAIFTCVEKLFPDDFDKQSEVINVEMLKYTNKEGSFGMPLATKGCADENYDPVGWWSIYGNCVPNLQRMAIRILSLTTSSSECERNWSTFEGKHTKKRNRLVATRLRDLVYVQFNAKLLNKNTREKGMKVDVLLASEASKAQGWIVDGGDEEVDLEETFGGEALEVDSGLEPWRNSRNLQVRELDEEEFESDEEGIEEDVEFESNTEGVLE